MTFFHEGHEGTRKFKIFFFVFFVCLVDNLIRY